MKFNELKKAYIELKTAENALKMPLLKQERTKLKAKITKLTNILKKYESLFFINAKILKQNLDDYFKSKNANADIGYFYETKEYKIDDFYGEDTCYSYYSYLAINIDDEKYSTPIYARFERNSNFNDLDFYTMKFKTNILDIMNAFFESEDFAKLYEDFDDILDALWNLILGNIKKLNQQKIEIINAKQQEKRNMIIELTDQTIIAKKVEKIEGEILELEGQKAQYADDDLDNITTTSD